MIEQLNIDMVADAITSQVMAGVPQAKLAHRFFRKGRRDGRRQLDPIPVGAIDQTAVAIAKSRVREQYLRERDALEQKLAALTAGFVRAQKRAGEPVADWGDGETPAPAPSAPLPQDDGVSVAQVLGTAMSRMRERERVNAQSERRREAIAKREAAQSEMDAADVETHRLEAGLRLLEERFRQQQRTCEEVGHLLWARYVSGYEYGQTRRWRRGGERRAVETFITFGDYSAASETPAD